MGADDVIGTPEVSGESGSDDVVNDDSGGSEPDDVMAREYCGRAREGSCWELGGVVELVDCDVRSGSRDVSTGACAEDHVNGDAELMSPQLTTKHRHKNKTINFQEILNTTLQKPRK